MTEERLERLLASVGDLYHRRRIRQALRNGEALTEVQEVIQGRYADPRGLHNTHVTEQGGGELYDDFIKENVDESTGQRVAGMDIEDAPTSRRNNPEDVDEGITKMNELLGSPGKMTLFSQPHLFVSDRCQQVIWMLGNYTGRGGSKGASKDFCDLVKYSCLADLEHIEEGKALGRPGRGW
jgi:hypothetical protein